LSNDKNKETGLSRRQFMKRSGAAAGIAVGVGAASVVPITRTPYDQAFPVVESNHVELPPNGKSVVIMGGGLSGLQTGVELSARGFKVTVLEKTGTPGGKLKTWRDKTFGPANDPAKKDPNFKGYVREHGVHAIWGFYNNLREFMKRYGWGLLESHKDSSIYLFMGPDGKRADWSLNSIPPPYGALVQAANLDMGDFVKDEDKPAAILFMRSLCSFDFTDEKQRDYMDSIAFEEWALMKGCPKDLIDTMMDALIEMAFFDNAKTASALSLATIVQLCVGAPQYDMRADLYMNPPGETFLEPMAEYIRQHGGEIVYNAELTDIEMVDGVVESVSAEQIGNGQQRMTRCSICGALLGPNGDELTKCPICGANGDMIQQLDDAQLRTRRYNGDFFVSAMDIPASKRFYSDNMDEFGSKDYFKKINKLSHVIK